MAVTGGWTPLSAGDFRRVDGAGVVDVGCVVLVVAETGGTGTPPEVSAYIHHTDG